MSKNGLTPKQEAFCLAYVELSDATAAYRRAYDAEGMKREVIRVKACELMKTEKIRARLEEIQSGLRDRHEVTVERIIAELAKIAFVDADKDENQVVQNKLSALDKLGRHIGMFTAKVEHTGKDGAPLLPENSASPRDLARAIMDIFRSAATENKDDPQ
jgi:phage terminase small subunit